MIEIQCTSCNTRYRIDERMLPEDSPSFKCSRCGHVFTTDPKPLKSRRAAMPASASEAETSEAQAARVRAPKPRPQAPQAVSDAAAIESGPIQPGPIEARPVEPGPIPARPIESKPIQARLNAELKPPRPRSLIRNPQPAASGDPANAAGQTDPPGAAAAIESSAERSGASIASPAEPPPAAEDLLERPISRAADDARLGENLSFDFSDDTPDLGKRQRASVDEWRVGDETPDTAAPAERGFKRPEAFTSEAFSPEAGAPEGFPMERGGVAEYPGSAAMASGELRDDVAYVEQAQLHSAGFFLGWFFAVALVFAALTLEIYATPSASADLLRRLPLLGPHFAAPIPLESMVSVADVQASYQTVKGGRPALVIGGIAENTGAVALHVVQIGCACSTRAGTSLRIQPRTAATRSRRK